MSRLVSPLARVRIGTDTFVSGDGILKSVSVELGEDKRSSRCQFELYDKGLLWGAKYQAISFAQGGIITPEGLLIDRIATSAPATHKSDPSGVTTSGTSTQNAGLKPEVRAFLDTIAWAEGGHYNVMYTGRRFSSYADHPRVRFPLPRKYGGKYTTAAGRYQFIDTTWDSLRKKLGLKDFSPANQDLAAIELIRSECKALGDVERGSAGFRTAVYKCSTQWASFPASTANQPRKSMAELSVIYVRSLQKYQNQNPAQAAAATQPQVQDKAQTGTLQDKAATKPQEVKEKGCEIVVELGYSLDQMVAYHFFHIGTTTSRDALDTTVFEGQMVRWLMARRKYNTTYANITLRQLAQMICSRYGLRLDMEGNGATYQHLDQTGISDYELLNREARAIGYSIREEKNVLILKPYRPNFTGFVITRDICQSIRFTDRASADYSPTPGTTVSTPLVSAAQTKTKHDRKTGLVVQTRIEDSTGTGASNGKPVSVTGTATPAIKGTTILDSSVTGLPKQEIGSIDLADGKAEAQAIADEAKRVKGYESTCTIITTPEALTLAPGSIIALDENVAPTPFAREWRVASIRHTLSISGMRSSLEFYSPQAQKDDSATPLTVDTVGGNNQIILQGDLASLIIKYSKSKGYEIPVGKQKYYICYLEGCNADGSRNENRLNEFSDRRIVIEIDGARPRIVCNYLATTEPGAFYTFNPINAAGVARIAFGQFKAWQMGIHKNHPALVQRGEIKVYRDRNKDGLRNGDPISEGVFGINQHWGGDSPTIDKWSAGCLVGQKKLEHLKFINILRRDIRFQMDKNFIFSTTILDGLDFAAWVQKQPKNN